MKKEKEVDIMAFCGEGGGWSRSKNMREILKATFLNVILFGTDFSPQGKFEDFFQNT
jgi:hypothetical protein